MWTRKATTGAAIFCRAILGSACCSYCFAEVSPEAKETSIRQVPAPLASPAFFVAPDGKDTNVGSQQSPWRTIQHAVKQAEPGVTVYVRAGVYEEGVKVEKSGTQDKPIVLASFPGERSVIDGRFRTQYGLLVTGRHITVRGLEIRNCTGHPGRYGVGGMTVFPGANNCLMERNIVHHIIGGEHAAIGISCTGVKDATIQNNTVYYVAGHTESMGMKIDQCQNANVRRNLVYFCDKEGIRLIRTETKERDLVVGNIAIFNHFGIAPNNCYNAQTVLVRSNFCGWNWARGMLPKHHENLVLEHNTLHGNAWSALGMWGGPTGNNHSTVVKNNLFSHSKLMEWRLMDADLDSESVDYNFYHSLPGLLVARFSWANSAACRSVEDIREKTGKVGTVNGPYEVHGKQGDPGFVNPQKGDFRLGPDSPARKAADDEKDMGAVETELTEVGASREYGLSRIPDLGWLKTAVEAFSSETDKGRAGNAVDGARETYWEADLEADPKPEIVLRMPGGALHELTYLILIKDGRPPWAFYRAFEVYVRDEANTWTRVPEPPEHPFAGYGGLCNGQVWALPKGTTARAVKIRILSGHKDIVRIPEIWIFGNEP
ncbi:MAG: right-handed parallel beta-helix repeat-containing protein [Planctomycetes bacterium]|nr:right-handed parallel beta-helix repeat-containing protein [Planctomycetota bacterium]MBL7043821.1 right-handed parallel beta-helix repeat-containing protein [Pirellulaceae bacterium]